MTFTAKLWRALPLALLLLALLPAGAGAQCAMNATTLLQMRLGSFGKFANLAASGADFPTQLASVAGALDDSTVLDVQATGTFGGPDHGGLELLIEYVWLANYNKNNGYLQTVRTGNNTLTPLGPNTIRVLSPILTAFHYYAVNVTGTFNYTITYADCSPLITHVYLEWDQALSDAGVANTFSFFETCDSIMKSCTGTNQVYSSTIECMLYMQTLRRSVCTGAGFMGDCYTCRFLHHVLAAFKPEVHCPHVARNSVPCNNANCRNGVDPIPGCPAGPSVTNIVFNNYGSSGCSAPAPTP